MIRLYASAIKLPRNSNRISFVYLLLPASLIRVFKYSLFFFCFVLFSFFEIFRRRASSISKNSVSNWRFPVNFFVGHNVCPFFFCRGLFLHWDSAPGKSDFFRWNWNKLKFEWRIFFFNDANCITKIKRFKIMRKLIMFVFAITSRYS